MLEGGHTPLNWREWDHSLKKHPDQRFRAYIVDGIHYGFLVGFDYNRTCRKSHHMFSALEKPEASESALPRSVVKVGS